MKTKKSLATTLATVVLGFAITLGLTNVAPIAYASGPGGGGGGGGGGAGGGGGIVTGTQAIANVLRGPWEGLVADTILTVTFNNNGTFTATIQSPSGTITSDSGTWKLSAPVAASPFSNPSAHIVIVDKQGVVLLAGDVLLINADQLVMMPATDGITPIPQIGEVVLTKMTI